METKDYLNELRDYIDNHTDFIIINRAAIYVPTLIKQNDTHFEF